jgi:acetyl/propionyl-CoA carboxylase alpha subunit
VNEGSRLSHFIRVFRKILIANRGEIALRVIRTARALGVRTVAVFSEADRGAPHVWLADEAHEIGPAPAARSYLDARAILAAARRSGAEAVHPGYGFLAESPEFARAVRAAGLAFVGPSEETLAAVGEKTSARRLMAAAGVPLVPGSKGALQSAAEAALAAREIGFPVLLKPAGGGGGKGMRLVRGPGEMEREFAAGAREAAKAFGNSTLYLERHLERVRHLEVQVLGTPEGVLALGERECSIQRRHQKLVEESPSPVVGPWDSPADGSGEKGAALRERLAAAAVRAAGAVRYQGAGTVEFLLDAVGEIYFIEVNARLQVEHPVTELVTGLDLVEAQLRLAAGEPLPARFREFRPRGWAIEVRVCAEDPERDFLPATGMVRSLRLPAGPGVRWDGWVEEGTVVGPHYDSLLGKLAAWGEDRPLAIDRLQAGLDELRIEGLTTNLAFLRRVARDDAFRAGALHTGFVQERRTSLAAVLVRPERLAVAAVWEVERGLRSGTPHAAANGAARARLSAWRAERPPFVWIR